MTDQNQAFGTLLERPPAKRDAKAKLSSPRKRILRTLPSLRERTRAANRDRYRSAATSRSALMFRCECARPDCTVKLPLEVERHRRWSDRFIVCLAHADVDSIVGVADHFFVVEANGHYAVPMSVARAAGRVSSDGSAVAREHRVSTPHQFGALEGSEARRD
jgi:hypothetical protein